MKKIEERILEELGDSPASCAVLELVNEKSVFTEEEIAERVNDKMQDYFFFDEENLGNDNEAMILANEISVAIDFIHGMGELS